MRLIGWLLALPLSLLAVVFAVANRHDLRLDLWPLPWSLDLPVYLAVLGPLVLGMVLGGLATWLAGHRTRTAARHHRRRAESLERQLTAAGGAASASAPALPPPAAGQG
ncbi:MAG TPA: lipopolysaccharide assembly protein LapA domain-containing protein [Magnetospirillum sp.]|nr:lipopolysaccharide assembly protein LapA domain-containing protein [Magnetospirillum sp.]